MKKIILILLLFADFIGIQNATAQDRAGIYSINFFIDRKLTHPVQVQVDGNIVQNGGLNATRLSDLDIDSIKRMIERRVSLELGAQTECIYRKNKRGRDVVTTQYSTNVRGLPTSSRNTAIKLHEKEFYVRVRISFNAVQRTSLGAALIGIKQYRPIVTITIIAYNEQRRAVYRKRVFVNDFEKLQGFETNTNGVIVRNFQVLTPQQIRDMLAKSLQELSERGKQ